MYWRGGFWRGVLWILSLTALLSAGAVWAYAGSATAAQALVVVAVVISPFVHEAAARALHVRAPPRLAFFTTALLVPVALAFIAIDGIAVLEREAQRQGFASAAELDRARSLKIPTPTALALHDEAQHKARVAQMCKDQAARPPLACFGAGHRAAAVAFADSQLDAEELAVLAREALAEQRKRFMAADRECQALLDRIDEDALPAILASRDGVLERAGALWAARLTQRELELMVERSKPGVAHLSTPESDVLEKKIDDSIKIVDRELGEDIKVWAQRIAMDPSGWRNLLRGRTPVGPCKMVQVSQLP